MRASTLRVLHPLAMGILAVTLAGCANQPLLKASPRAASTHDAVSSPTRKSIWHEKTKEKITLRFADEELTVVHFAAKPRPFLYPFYAPGGVPVTRAWPQEEREGEARDHPHHTSVWFAHGDVNGVDFWHPQAKNGGVIEYTGRLNELLSRGKRLRTRHTYTWKGPKGEELLHERRTLLFGAEHDQRWVDTKFELTALKDEVVFGDTKEGTFAMRLHPALRLKGEVATGSILNAAGDKDGKVWGERAAWVHYGGTIDEQEVGVAIFEHPDNFRHPTWWHARDYGLVAANPFGTRAFEGGNAESGRFVLKQDETLVLRYRIWTHTGERTPEEIAAAFKVYVIQSEEM
ncbi:MAG TPA: hypothetical protein EYQ74_14100 [Planctomycetes bacterium]|nr:hypothetical protein [Planctomycetota bacterium]HIK60284.1 hypothetical protein [Planctomycetota bacterium]